MRARLVAMLLAGGATITPPIEGKVLSLLERSGVFLAGGVIVGTLTSKSRSTSRSGAPTLAKQEHPGST